MGVMDGKVAIVTGASKGIGQVIATGLAEHGAAVVVNYKTDRDGAEETRRRIEAAGGRALVAYADVGRSADAIRLVTETAEKLGRVDLLVNNAARTRFGPASDITDDDFDDVVNTNVRGPFFASVALYNLAREAGGGAAIINISSCAANLIMPFHSIYTTSKGGLEAMTRQLALEFAPHVRVNCISPAPTSNERNLTYDPNYNESWAPLIPMGRVGYCEDYIGPTVFLGTEQSGFLTGEVLHVDGGWSLRGQGPDMAKYDLSGDRQRG